MKFVHTAIDFVQANDWTWPVAMFVVGAIFLFFTWRWSGKKTRIIITREDGSVWDVPAEPDHHTGLRRR